MKTPSFKSFASMLLAGALSAPLVGCGPEGAPNEAPHEADDDAVASETGALIRTAAVADVDIEAATVDSTAITTRTPTTPIATATVAMSATMDLERNHPWTVSISGTGGLTCRGTLVHPLWVATAAHCIGSIAGHVTSMVNGEQRPFNVNGPQRGMFVHPEFDPDSGFGQPKNDIALIRLATPFTINAGIQTAALPRYFGANPGRVGTIATNNHNNAPDGYTSIVRAPQLSATECTTPSGFLCIGPPAGSLCAGDSGSGFVEMRDGRATLVGITSNIDSSGSDCIGPNDHAQLVDVYAYRGWIHATMGLSPEQVDGRVRLRWSGVASQPGIMSLQCISAPMPAVEVPMNIPGSEIGMDCEDVRVFCQPQGANLNLSGFLQRTFAANGTLLSTQQLPYLPTFTAAFADPGSSFLAHTCSVYNAMNPAVNQYTSGGVLAKAL